MDPEKTKAEAKPIPEGTFLLLNEGDLQLMPTPPECFAEVRSAPLAVVSWEWWSKDSDSGSLTLDRTELPPREVQIPTMSPGDLALLIIECPFAPTRLDIWGYEDLSDEGSVDLESIAYEVSCSTVGRPPELCIDINPERTAVTIGALPDLSILLVQGEWQVATFIGGRPTLACTWAVYLND